MSYNSWFENHGNKHKELIEKLLKRGFDKDEIIEYFKYENLKKNEPNFCPLFAKNKKCHEMEELNCYLCACPNFRFNDSGFKEIEDKTLYSYCQIDSKDGEKFISSDKIHQNCTNCTIPHHKNYIEKHFSFDWLEIMKECKS